MEFFQKAIQFLKEFKVEMKKVTWPSRKDTIASTSVVLVITIIVALYLGLADWLITRGIRLILS